MQPSWLHLLVVLVSLAAIATLGRSEFTVIPQRRGQNDNNINLECRDENTASIPNARFWLNEVSRRQDLLELNIGASRSTDSRSIFFLLTQNLEGTYLCGRDLENYSENGVVLIAYPDPRVVPRPERTFFAKVGTTAYLNCSILPGALHDRYYADWKNANSSVEVGRVQGPRAGSQLPTPDPRYTVDQDTFSLVISSVSLADRGNYRCVLGVKDPGGTRFLYTQTENVDLTLIVYEEAILTRTPPEQTIIPLDTQEDSNQVATFECQARGEPAPTIVWQHNSMMTDSPDKYTTDTFSTKTSTQDFIVTSRLTIMNLNSFDNGNVTCKVMTDLDDLLLSDATQLQTVSHTSQLAVLGSFFSLVVLISTNRDVIFKLGLPASINVPVQLHICYTDVNDPDVTFTRVTNSAYMNTSKIIHFESSSHVPTFDNFRVKIALRHQDRQGPFNQSSLQYNLLRPNLFMEGETGPNETVVISVAVTVTCVCLILGVVIPILVVVCSCCKIKCLKNKHDQDLEEKRTDHDNNLRRNHETNQRELDRVREQHRSVLSQIEEKNDTDIRKLEEKNSFDLEKMKAEHEKQLQELQQQYSFELHKMAIEKKSKSRQQIIEVFERISTKNSCARLIMHRQGSIGIEYPDKCVREEVDGPQIEPNHTNYIARSKPQPMITAGETTADGENGNEGSDEVDHGMVLECIKCVIEAGMNDPRYREEVRTYVNTSH